MKNTFLATILLIVALPAVADELKPVKSIDEFAKVLEIDTSKDEGGLVFQINLIREIPGFAKAGEKVEMKILSVAGPGKKSMIDDATFSKDGETVKAFHTVWGLDNSGQLKNWTFNQDGSMVTGLVFTDGKRVVTKMTSKFSAASDAERKMFGGDKVHWTGDLVFVLSADGKPTSQMTNMTINGRKMPDQPRNVGRFVQD